MVAGQPERVQSPARTKFGTFVRSRAGELPTRAGRRTARTSFTTWAFSSLAPRRGKKLGQLPERQSDHIGARHIRQAARRAHHQLHARPSCLLNIHWMVRSSSVAWGKVGHGAVEPQMDSGDRRVFEPAEGRDPVPERPCRHAFEGQRAHVEVRAQFGSAGDDVAHCCSRSRCVRRARAVGIPRCRAFHCLASVGAAERHGGHAHLVGICCAPGNRDRNTWKPWAAAMDPVPR